MSQLFWLIGCSCSGLRLLEFRLTRKRCSLLNYILTLKQGSHWGRLIYPDALQVQRWNSLWVRVDTLALTRFGSSARLNNRAAKGKLLPEISAQSAHNFGRGTQKSDHIGLCLICPFCAEEVHDCATPNRPIFYMSGMQNERLDSGYSLPKAQCHNPKGKRYRTQNVKASNLTDFWRFLDLKPIFSHIDIET
jgi:hypothetical protein